MTPILEWGNNLIVLIQSMGEWLTIPMAILSFLGTEQFFLIVAPVIYWCIDATLGLRLGIFLMTATGLNAIFKVLCHAPRPYWVDTRVKAYSSETTFGAPSGHSMISTVIWGTLAVSLRNKIMWAISIILIFLIGFSRLYLGVHFPSDVLLGWLLGALLLWIFIKVEKPIIAWLKGKSPLQKISLAFAFSLSILCVYWLAHLSLGGWQIPEIWIQNAALATDVVEPINPLDPSGVVTACGALFGFALGYILLELQGGFETEGSLWNKITRFFIGLLGILLFWECLGFLLPDRTDPFSLSLRYLRYTLVGAWISGGAPWIFLRCGLSKKPTHNPI